MSLPKSDRPQGEGESPTAKRLRRLADLATTTAGLAGVGLYPPRTAAGEYLRTIALVEAVRGTLPAESLAMRLEEEAERLRRILCPPDPLPGPNPADFCHPAPLPVYRPPTAEEIGAAAARHLPDPANVEELRERIAELEARLDAPPAVPADKPKPRTQARTQGRQQSLTRIIDALLELDPDLHIKALPGIRADLFQLCRDLDKEFHYITLRTFENDIEGWLKFRKGGKSGKNPYYLDQQEAVKKLLAAKEKLA